MQIANHDLQEGYRLQITANQTLTLSGIHQQIIANHLQITGKSKFQYLQIRDDLQGIANHMICSDLHLICRLQIVGCFEAYPHAYKGMPQRGPYHILRRTGREKER